MTVGAATLGGTGFINGPVTLTGDSTLTSTGALTINSTLTVQGLANQLSSGTVNTSGDVTIEPGAVFIINGMLDRTVRAGRFAGRCADRRGAAQVRRWLC